MSFRTASLSRGLPAAFLAALTLVAPPARADRGDEEEFLEALGDVALFVETEVRVSGATRRVAKLKEAPGTITVISAEEIRDWGALTLGEAIRHVASVTFAPGNVALAPTFRDIAQPFGNKVLLLQDGRVLNSVFRGNAYVDLSQPLDSVARIEVVKGPGSALYGANAFAGFINVITRRGDQVEGVEVRATAGTDGLRHLAAVAGGRKGRLDWVLDARGAAADGVDAVNDPGNADHEAAHVGFHLGRGGSKGETWFVDASLAAVSAGVPGVFSFPTPEDRLEEERLSLDGFRQWAPSKNTKLKLRGYWNQQDDTYSFRHADVDLTPLSDDWLGRNTRLAWGAAPTFGLRTGQPTPGSEPDDPGLCQVCDHVVLAPPGGGTAAEYALLAGSGLPQVTDDLRSKEWMGFVELQADWQVSSANYLLGGVSLRHDDLDNASTGARRFRNAAAFVEDEHRFLRGKLLLLGSLRVDDHSFFGQSVSPRVSLIWSKGKRLVMKAAYGKAFRSPNFVELFGDTRTGTARLFGQVRAVEEGRIPEVFTRATCLDPPDCTNVRTDTFDTTLRQEEIQTAELWTEYAPTERLRFVLNLYQFEIANEVGVALDRNDVYYFAPGPEARAILGAGVPRDAIFLVPGLEDVPTFGVFLNAPEKSWGAGAEFEVHARPKDWLDLSWTYSRRRNRQAEVREFVEADDLSPEQRIVPTFGTRRLWTDQAGAAVTFRVRERAWASVRLRFLGRPDSSFFSPGGAFTADLTLGWRLKDFTVSATALDVNEGGTLFDPIRGDFVEPAREVRLLLAWRHAF